MCGWVTYQSGACRRRSWPRAPTLAASRSREPSYENVSRYGKLATSGTSSQPVTSGKGIFCERYGSSAMAKLSNRRHTSGERSVEPSRASAGLLCQRSEAGDGRLDNRLTHRRIPGHPPLRGALRGQRFYVPNVERGIGPDTKQRVRIRVGPYALVAEAGDHDVSRGETEPRRRGTSGSSSRPTGRGCPDRSSGETRSGAPSDPPSRRGRARSRSDRRRRSSRARARRVGLHEREEDGVRHPGGVRIAGAGV